MIRYDTVRNVKCTVKCKMKMKMKKVKGRAGEQQSNKFNYF